MALTLEREGVETAKTYAKEKGQSLSERVENHLIFVTVGSRDIKEGNFHPGSESLEE